MTRHIIDHDAAVNRIVARLDEATATDIATGSAWYGEAYRAADRIAESTRNPIDLVAAVIAHLSPQTRWVDNVAYAWHLFTNLEGTKPSGALGDNVARARGAIVAHYGNEDPLESFGPYAHKTKAFARAILGDVDSVVIDTWAVRAALTDGRGFRDGTVDDMQKVIRRRGVYSQVADVYRDAAAISGLNPCAVQSIVWGVLRGSFE